MCMRALTTVSGIYSLYLFLQRRFLSLPYPLPVSKRRKGLVKYPEVRKIRHVSLNPKLSTTISRRHRLPASKREFVSLCSFGKNPPPTAVLPATSLGFVGWPPKLRKEPGLFSYASCVPRSQSDGERPLCPQRVPRLKDDASFLQQVIIALL